MWENVRALAPLALLIAALVALVLTAPNKPILGLSHDDFMRGAFGSALLSWLLLSGLARAGQAGSARVLSGVVTWAFIGAALVAIYAFRPELAEVRDRLLAELDQGTLRVGPSGEVIIRRRYGDEFIISGKVNSHPVVFVFDTGASSVVLSAEDASAIGLTVNALNFGVPVITANGAANAAPATLERLSVGPIVVHDVRALVARPGMLRESLLGMSFLERLKSYSVEGGKLVLKGN